MVSDGVVEDEAQLIKIRRLQLLPYAAGCGICSRIQHFLSDFYPAICPWFEFSFKNSNQTATLFQ